MKRFIVFVGLVIVAAAPTAFAQSASEVADGLGDDGVYVEPGVSVDLADLRDSVELARNNGFGLFVVVLDEDPPSGAATFADSVLDELGDGTVLVLSESSEGMASTELEQPAIESALDAGFDSGGGDEGYVAGVVDAIVASIGSESSGGGGSGLIILLVIVGGLVLIVVWAVGRSNRASQRRRVALLAEARSEIEQQLDSMANTILDIADLVSASDSREDDRHFEEASAAYTAALEAYETAGDLSALETLSDRLDLARWQLDAAAAIAQGREPPPRPEPAERPVCFFDPTHRDATETVDIQTASGTRTVRVCRADAERIRRGTKPEPRMIEHDGRRVPAPVAPKSHGGGGMDWLEAFSILASGGVGGLPYDWTSGRGRGSRGRTPTSRSGGKLKRSRAGRSRRRRR